MRGSWGCGGKADTDGRRPTPPRRAGRCGNRPLHGPRPTGRAACMRPLHITTPPHPTRTDIDEYRRARTAEIAPPGACWAWL